MGMCYVIAREGVSGGTGSLSYRLLSYLHTNGYKCAYLCCENNSPQTFSLIESVSDHIIMDDDKSYKRQFDALAHYYDTFVFLTYSINEFLSIDSLRKCFPSIRRSFLYVVHAGAFSTPFGSEDGVIKDSIMRFYFRIKFRRLIKALLDKQAILFMDEISVRETERTLKLHIDKELIRLLPIAIRDYPDTLWNTITRHKPFTIGTMCRMEFPFKGYVIGLIDAFIDLLKHYDVRLYLVGDGPDVSILKDKLANLPQNIRESIFYKESIPYSELESFYSQCDLALGMGTVLLDAANFNVLAIPVYPYTMSLKVTGLFKDNIDWLCVRGEEHDFQDTIEALINMPDDTFRAMIHEQYLGIKEHYSIESFIKEYVYSNKGELMLQREDRIVHDTIRRI